MPILLGLSLVVQLFFIVHVYRSGAPRYWAFIILIFPVAGCLAYYFIEVFPTTREARTVRRAARDVVRSVQAPDKALREKAAELAVCGSIDNRLALAAECLEFGLPDEAARLYASCLTGPYEQDPTMLFGLARALVEQGIGDQAEATLFRLKSVHPEYKPGETALLGARAAEAQGKLDDALAAYRALLPAFVGLEARYRYGLLLDRLGHREQAHTIFEELLSHAKRYTSAVAAETQWAKLARKYISGAAAG